MTEVESEFNVEGEKEMEEEAVKADEGREVEDAKGEEGMEDAEEPEPELLF